MTVKTGEILVYTIECSFQYQKKDPNNHSETETGTQAETLTTKHGKEGKKKNIMLVW